MPRLIIAGVAGAALIVPVELVALHAATVDLVWTTLGLMLASGLLIGAVIAAAEWLIRRFELGALPAAAVRSAIAWPVFAFVAAHLFDGGYAATLPGATSAFYWLPLLGVLLLAAGIYVAAHVHARGQLRWLIPAILALAVLAAEYTNRTMFRTTYPDVHVFLTVASIAAATVFVHLTVPLAEWLPDRRQRAIAAGAITGVLIVNLAFVLWFGLQPKESRWTVATHGTHARHLTRVVRELFDRDHDGFSSVLGGGDCNDHDDHINPAAVDTPGNGIDEDCDGVDAKRRTPEQHEQHKRRAATVAQWLNTKPVSTAVAAAARNHTIVIMVDALRFDLLADTPQNGAEFPNLFAFRREARFYTRAFAPASGTDVSTAVLLTGELDPFKPIAKTLIERVAATGAVTHAVVPDEMLRWAGKTLFTRGLAGYDHVVSDRVAQDYGDHSTSAETTRRGLAFIDKLDAGKRFWLWLHYFDVHEHHQLRESDRKLRAALGGRSGRVARYRATVKLVDAELGRLRAALKKRGLWRRTNIVILSDHGEGLGEDRRLPTTHGEFIYNPLIHVPLMIRVPGWKPGTTERTVPLMDVTPTLLALAGAPVPESMDGKTLLVDLLPNAPKGSAEHRPILLNESQQHGVIDWPYKLMIRPKDNLIELYDISRDFAEKHDLADDRKPLLRRLKQLYQSYPRVRVSRTPKARQRREKLAQPPGG